MGYQLAVNQTPVHFASLPLNYPRKMSGEPPAGLRNNGTPPVACVVPPVFSTTLRWSATG